MDSHERQQFDQLLLGAADRLAERAVQRCAGVPAALHQLRTDPDGEGAWLGDFVDAVFAESCLDTADGAAWVLRALHRRPAPAPPAGAASVGELLVATAKAAFAAMLAGKVIEALDRSHAYG